MYRSKLESALLGFRNKRLNVSNVKRQLYADLTQLDRPGGLMNEYVGATTRSLKFNKTLYHFTCGLESKVLAIERSGPLHVSCIDDDSTKLCIHGVRPLGDS